MVGFQKTFTILKYMFTILKYMFIFPKNQKFKGALF